MIAMTSDSHIDKKPRDASSACATQTRPRPTSRYLLRAPRFPHILRWMDTSKRERTPEEREQLRREIVEDGRGLLGYFWPFRPMQLGLDLVWAVLRLFQPLAPHLIPLAVFSATLPLILFLSFGSGYLVWKSVAVSWETDIYLQYGCVTRRQRDECMSKAYPRYREGGSPYAEVMLPNIVAQQPYDISLHLVVPASEANFALGNFMATLTLLTPSNATIATAHRPVSADMCEHGADADDRNGRQSSFHLFLRLGRIYLGDQASWT